MKVGLKIVGLVGLSGHLDLQTPSSGRVRHLRVLETGNFDIELIDGDYSLLQE